MGLALTIGIVLAVLTYQVFSRSYRWIRGVLGEAPPRQVPSARLTGAAGHRGFRHEPLWLRPVQAAMLAAGITTWVVSAVSFLVVAACAAFV